MRYNEIIENAEPTDDELFGKPMRWQDRLVDMLHEANVLQQADNAEGAAEMLADADVFLQEHYDGNDVWEIHNALEHMIGDLEDHGYDSFELDRQLEDLISHFERAMNESEPSDDELFGQSKYNFGNMTGAQAKEKFNEIYDALYGYDAQYNDEEDDAELQAEMAALMNYVRLRFDNNFYEYLRRELDQEAPDDWLERHNSRNTDPLGRRRDYDWPNNDRLTKAGKLYKQDQQTAAKVVRGRLGKHHTPNLPESDVSDEELFGTDNDTRKTLRTLIRLRKSVEQDPRGTGIRDLLKNYDNSNSTEQERAARTLEYMASTIGMTKEQFEAAAPDLMFAANFEYHRPWQLWDLKTINRTIDFFQYAAEREQGMNEDMDDDELFGGGTTRARVEQHLGNYMDELEMDLSNATDEEEREWILDELEHVREVYELARRDLPAAIDKLVSDSESHEWAGSLLVDLEDAGINISNHYTAPWLREGDHSDEELFGADVLPGEYEVYRSQPGDQFKFLGSRLFSSDTIGEAHRFAYEKWKRNPNNFYTIWQKRNQSSRGGYGPEGSFGEVYEDLEDDELFGTTSMSDRIARLLQAKQKVFTRVMGARGQVMRVDDGGYLVLRTRPGSTTRYSWPGVANDPEKYKLTGDPAEGKWYVDYAEDPWDTVK